MSFVAESEISVSIASPSDFLQLLKPRVMSLVVFTALAGMLIAPQGLHPVLAAISLLAIAVGAGASGALNMWYDADIDAVMARTARRPVPAGRVSRDEALTFGLTLSAFAIVTLGLAANWLAAFLLAFTIFFYVVVYTIWLKRRTPLNIVIGGAAGAFPPVVGYAAMTGRIDLAPLILFALIFIWTPPHFWALALVKCGDYAKAGIPMMPNSRGADHTRRQILAYTLLLAPTGLLPFVLGFGGLAYGIVGLVSGGLMLHFAGQVFRRREGAEADAAAKRLFAFSILYLFLLFAVLVVEHAFRQIARGLA
jgi:protoheme IX farnesyltransferase